MDLIDSVNENQKHCSSVKTISNCLLYCLKREYKGCPFLIVHLLKIPICIQNGKIAVITYVVEASAIAAVISSFLCCD